MAADEGMSLLNPAEMDYMNGWLVLHACNRGDVSTPILNHASLCA